MPLSFGKVYVQHKLSAAMRCRLPGLGFAFPMCSCSLGCLYTYGHTLSVEGKFYVQLGFPGVHLYAYIWELMVCFPKSHAVASCVVFMGVSKETAIMNC
jgi:hypothetical protein